MTDKKGTSKNNEKYEKVVLEKIGSHVEIYGPYTKRGLRRLLLSSVSLYPVADHEKETLKQIGINEQELKKIIDGQKVSEKTQKTLQDLEITKDMISKAAEKTTADDSRSEAKERREENNEENKKEKSKMTRDKKDFYAKVKKDKDHERKRKKSIEDAKENFIKLLKQKEISEDLMNRLLKNGLTEETIRLLKSLGLSTEDLENLQTLWQIQLSEIAENESSRSETSQPSSSDEYMSLDSLYLKSYVSTPVKEALREIILRKPIDPVEFLGQWLLHFKVCEEREKKRKECKMELMIEREKMKLKPKSEPKVDYLIQNENEKEEEEFEETWNFLEDNVIY